MDPRRQILDDTIAARAKAVDLLKSLTEAQASTEKPPRASSASLAIF